MIAVRYCRGWLLIVDSDLYEIIGFSAQQGNWIKHVLQTFLNQRREKWYKDAWVRYVSMDLFGNFYISRAVPEAKVAN